MINPELPSGSRPIDVLARSSALDPLGETLASFLRKLRDANPSLKSMLSGTWLGHSLHPILTDVPIGAFATLMLLDAVEISGNRTVGPSADLVLGFAIVVAGGAAVTGWSDWSDTAGAPRRIGLYHALLNGAALSLYVASFGVRRARGAARLRPAAIALDTLALGLLASAAYFGGELTTGMQLAVRHTAEPLAPPDDFADVAAESDVIEGRPLLVRAGGLSIVLVRRGEEISALGNACSHRGASLAEGDLAGNCIVCPWHGSRFSLLDGSVAEGPATFPAPVYEVRVADGRVAVRAVAG